MRRPAVGSVETVIAGLIASIAAKMFLGSVDSLSSSISAR